MDRKTFQQGIAYLAAGFDAELSNERIAVYWDQLNGLKDDLFLTAVKTAVGHGRRFPTVSQLREHYRDALRRRVHTSVQLPARPVMEKGKVARIVADLRKKLQ